MGRYEADRLAEEIDAAMTTIRAAMVGIPFGRKGFTRQHDQLARDVAVLLLLVYDARGNTD